MDKKFTMKEYVVLASLLFGLFFGAGNLIFPALMGQAGRQSHSSGNFRVHHYGSRIAIARYYCDFLIT